MLNALALKLFFKLFYSKMWIFVKKRENIQYTRFEKDKKNIWLYNGSTDAICDTIENIKGMKIFLFKYRPQTNNSAFFWYYVWYLWSMITLYLFSKYVSLYKLCRYKGKEYQRPMSSLLCSIQLWQIRKI